MMDELKSYLGTFVENDNLLWGDGNIWYEKSISAQSVWNQLRYLAFKYGSTSSVFLPHMRCLTIVQYTYLFRSRCANEIENLYSSGLHMPFSIHKNNNDNNKYGRWPVNLHIFLSSLSSSLLPNTSDVIYAFETTQRTHYKNIKIHYIFVSCLVSTLVTALEVTTWVRERSYSHATTSLPINILWPLQECIN